jgi:CRP-like cAMP-binding protein
MNKEQALTSVSLFEKLDPRHIKAIAGIATERTYKAGDYLMKQGEDGIGLFMILSGTVRIEKTTPAGMKVEVARNGAGDVLGEMAVFDGAPRSASVVAESETTCLILAAWEFNSFLKTHHEVAFELLPIVVKRFRETNEALTGLRV